MSKIVRVYAMIAVQAAYDICIESDEDDPGELLKCQDHAPVHIDESTIYIKDVLGFVPQEQIHGANYAENLAEIDRRSVIAAQKAADDRQYALEEEEEEETET